MVQSEWIKFVTTNFRILWAKNLGNPRDRAPLKSTILGKLISNRAGPYCFCTLTGTQQICKSPAVGQFISYLLIVIPIFLATRPYLKKGCHWVSLCDSVC